MLRITIAVLLLIWAGSAKANPHIKKMAENVLGKLYQANGNQVYLKPQIIITKDDKEAALFLRSSNTIELSERAYQTPAATWARFVVSTGVYSWA
ncbi:MAG: hypothetical protein IPM82_20720 [Saprospiraceae bacterium]|nr:hypothetical protein [Saprospiraceae bacterium]